MSEFAKFFIQRPRFALMLALMMGLSGIIAIFKLPVALYPEITPPQITVTADYAGASAETVANTIAIPIEKEVNGVENMLYMSSTSNNSGHYQLDVSFEIGTDADQAQVKVQNRVERAVASLPEEVRSKGVYVTRRSSEILGYLQAVSPNGTHDRVFLNNYVSNNIKNNISRLYGIGDASIIGSDLSMRVWLDTDKMAALNLPIDEVKEAIENQNIQSALGSVGSEPNDGSSLRVFSLEAKGRLNNVDEFENIIIRTERNGGLLRLKDIAKIEVGFESYVITSDLDGRTSVPIMLNKLSGANSLKAMDAVKKELKRLSQYYPDDFDIIISYDSTEFVRVSVEEVIFTLFLTFILVVVVCYLFLQNLRATLIPSIAIPVSVLATFTAMLFLGYDINILTLFGLVLAVGLVVDDAIVVVERVLYLMQTENLSPKKAAVKTMEQVSSAIIATTLVLLAIFVPITFMDGITGKIYQQFAIAISFAVCFSSFNALTLSPALSAVLLRFAPKHRKGILYHFDNALDYSKNKYIALIRRLICKTGVILIILSGLIVFDVFSLAKIKTSFLPDEDQGMIISSIQLPEGASGQRTLDVIEKTRAIINQEDKIQTVVNWRGMSMTAGQGENIGSNVIVLKSWDKRKNKEDSSASIRARINRKMLEIPEADIRTFERPTIPGLGNSNGMELRLQSVVDNDTAALEKQLHQFIKGLNELPEIASTYSSFTSLTPHIFIDVDREKAELMNVSVRDIYKVLQAALGSQYINDVNLGTLTNRVMLAADWKYRQNAESIKKLHVRSNNGKMIPLGSLIDIKIITKPRIVERYNQYPSATINITVNETSSTGAAMEAVEKLAGEILSSKYAYEWSGISLQEKRNQGQAGYLICLAILFAYMFLVSQYESFSLPFIVMLSILTTITGAFIGMFIMGENLSIYAQLGLILLVGLSAKNAILIVEFAKKEQENSECIEKAAIKGVKERYRAVLMTAATFIFGVVPLVWATGASSGARIAVGVPVFYGMLLGTMGGIIVIPLLYALIQKRGRPVREL